MATIELRSLEVFSFCDPASGRQVLRRVRARSAIIVVAADNLQRFFVLHAWAGRPTTTQLVTRLLDVGEKFRPRRFGIEANAMQSLFADLVSAQARELKKRIPFVPIVQATKVDKDWRIRTTLQPVIENGRLFTQPNQHELITEISTFPVSTTKDMIDALASAIMLAPRRPAPERQRDELDALTAYLRNSGAPPSVIEARVREIQQEQSAVDSARRASNPYPLDIPR